jgi:arabinogalactan oligomer/maltooligosaccharide transport system permease protein
VIAVTTAVVGLALAATAAYALSRWAFPGRERGMAAFLVTQMFPGVVMAIPLYMLLDRLGLLDSMRAWCWCTPPPSVPFSTFTSRATSTRIPVALEEAAIMDGASAG